MNRYRNIVRRAPHRIHRTASHSAVSHPIRLAVARRAACIALGILFLCGCDEGQSPRERKAAQQAAAQREAQEAAQKESKQSATPTPTPNPTPTPSATPANPPASTDNTPTTTEQKAAVGAGKKGRDYGEGFVATPAASYWAMRERLAFEVLVPHALDLFKATEGRGPKDNDEFMEKIIKANQIKLPQLPEGSRYRYDPKKEQLMVEKPKAE